MVGARSQRRAARAATGRLRVVAGSAGGLRLESPAGPGTRPTAERVREAVFSSVGDAVGAGAVLDCYAGTGALGIEALSRGAPRAVLVEANPREAAVCRRNLARTGFADRGRVVVADVARFLDGPPPAEAPFALVCCDPPYETPDADVAEVLRRLTAPGWLTDRALVVVERPERSAVVVPSGWEPRFSRTYGDTLVHLVATGPARPAS